MITVIGGIQATVRIDMTMPKAPDPKEQAEQMNVSPWEQQAYGAGGRFGSMQMMPSGDPSKDRISVLFSSCGYNVARHLAGKSRQVAFVSVVGEDALGLAARAELEHAGVDVSCIGSIRELAEADEGEEPGGSDSGEHGREDAVRIGKDAPGTVANGLIRRSLTPVLVEAKNFLGDTEFWRADRRLLDQITPDRIEGCRKLIRESTLVFADGGLPAETLRWVADLCREHGTPLYFDPASVGGGLRADGLLHGLHGIMPGRQEAEAMSGLQILSEDQLMEAGAYFSDQGVKKVVITMKGGGLYYKEGMKEGVLRPDRVLRFSETVGAGDVVTAELLHAYANDMAIEEAAQAAMDAAADYLADCLDERRY